jgi:hypothetical protein
MPMLRSLALAMAAGMLAGLPVTGAQACDNDRYPCPVVAQPQDAANAAVSPQSRKKARRAARQDEAAGAKRERESPSSRVKAAAPGGQERSADAGDKKAADPARTLNEEVDRNESPVAAAAAAWLVLPSAAGAAPQTAASEAEAPPVAGSAVQMVSPNEMNELDRAAASAVPSESSWFNYLLMTLGAALAAASALRFLLV